MSEYGQYKPEPSYSEPIPTAPTVPTQPWTFLGLSLTSWIILFIVLAFLGFNIFIYIAKGNQSLSDFLEPYLGKVSSIFGNTVKKAINDHEKHEKDETQNEPNVELKPEPSIKGNNASSSLINGDLSNNNVFHQESERNPREDTDLSDTLNNAVPEDGPISYNSDDTGSSIQNRKTTGKAGWCYIGEDRGIRSCSQVGESDSCMSGNIFPSKEICVNPTLRQ